LDITQFRDEFSDQKLHVFGIGGTATLHIAALLKFNSVDSSGWRNRAARGMIQLPGTGERTIAGLGKWRGRDISQQDIEILKQCQCPACQTYGIQGLKLTRDDGQGQGSRGFYNRATHNLWVLLARLYPNPETLKRSWLWHVRFSLEFSGYRLNAGHLKKFGSLSAI
jgi:hypothetical protein